MTDLGPQARIATFTDMLLAHNVVERALVATIRAGGVPDFGHHHRLEEAMMHAMAGMTNAEVQQAIEAYDATPGAML